MTNDKQPRRAVAAIAAFSLLIQPTAPLVLAAGSLGQTATKPAAPSQQTPPKPATPAGATAQPAAASAATTSTPPDGGWPRTYDLPSGGNILMYQPQVATWDKQAHIVAFSAVSYRTKTGEKPALGTVKLEADTKVALTDRLVNFQNMKIVEANFQTLEKEQVREITARD